VEATVNDSRILVFGCNSISLEVARQLADRGWSLTLVSNDTACMERFQEEPFITAEADYTNDDELRALGLGDDVGALFTLFEDDAKNVFLVLSAKYIDPSLQVISLSQSEESGQKLLAAGADKVINPYKITGRKIYNMIKRPLVSEAIEKLVFGRKELNIAELRIQQGSFLNGMSLSELDLSRRYNLILLGVVDRERGDQFIFNTGSEDHKLDPQDVLVVIGQAREIERFRRESVPDGTGSSP